MKKSEILKILIRNRKNHIKEYNKAVQGYFKKAKRMLNRHQIDIQNNKVKGVYVSLAAPVDRRDQIQRVIEMYKHDVRAEIELTGQQYNEYILDKGNAAVQASTSNAFYTHSRSI